MHFECIDPIRGQYDKCTDNTKEIPWVPSSGMSLRQPNRKYCCLFVRHTALLNSFILNDSEGSWIRYHFREIITREWIPYIFNIESYWSDGAASGSSEEDLKVFGLAILWKMISAISI